MVPIISVLNHERISWVSIEIYYHDNFVHNHVHNRRGFGANDGIFLGMDLWSISPLYTTFRFDTCIEHLNICRMHF